MKLCGGRKVQSGSLSVQICKVRVIKSYLMELMQGLHEKMQDCPANASYYHL